MPFPGILILSGNRTVFGGSSGNSISSGMGGWSQVPGLTVVHFGLSFSGNSEGISGIAISIGNGSMVGMKISVSFQDSIGEASLLFMLTWINRSWAAYHNTASDEPYNNLQ